MEKFLPDRSDVDPGEPLSVEDQHFLDDYARRLDRILADIGTHPETKVSGILHHLFRPDSWRVILDLRKAEQLVDSGFERQSLEQSSAPSESQLNHEFDLKAAAVTSAVEDFAKFLDRDLSENSTHGT
jgi:hypothetical protein